MAFEKVVKKTSSCCSSKKTITLGKSGLGISSLVCNELTLERGRKLWAELFVEPQTRSIAIQFHREPGANRYVVNQTRNASGRSISASGILNKLNLATLTYATSWEWKEIPGIGDALLVSFQPMSRFPKGVVGGTR